LRTRQPASINGLLYEAQDRVQEAYDGDNHGDVPVAPVHGKPVADQQSHPTQEVAAFPDVRRPFLFAGRLILLGLSLGECVCHELSRAPETDMLLCVLVLRDFTAELKERAPFWQSQSKLQVRFC